MSQDAESNISRRKPLRLRGYDYSQSGSYFVTVCSHQKACLFGEIRYGQLEPTAAGRIVRECWYELSSHYAGIHLDEFTILPNHVHGVVILEKPAGTIGKGGVRIPRSRTLAEIVRGFKTFSARRINEIAGTVGKPVWQRGYYEHVIRTGKGFAAIRQYIRDNPGAWEKDPENYASPVRGRVSNPPLRRTSSDRET